MKTKELIEKLDLCKDHNYDLVKYYLPDDVCDEIIKRLEEYNELKKRMYEVGLCVDELVVRKEFK